MRFLTVATAVAMGASALSGCAVLGGGSEPLDTYVLAAPIPLSSGPRRSRAQILVNEPLALKSLDGQNIVIKPAAGSIEFLSGAQWADRLPRVMQARLVEAFQQSGRIGGVGRPGEGLAIDYQIQVEIRSFDVRLDGGDRANVELYVKLLNDRNGVVRRERVFASTVPVAGTGNAAYVAALDNAFARAAAEIVDWTASSI